MNPTEPSARRRKAREDRQISTATTRLFKASHDLINFSLALLPV